jgi:hypothetical protein
MLIGLRVAVWPLKSTQLGDHWKGQFDCKVSGVIGPIINGRQVGKLVVGLLLVVLDHPPVNHLARLVQAGE